MFPAVWQTFLLKTCHDAAAAIAALCAEESSQVIEILSIISFTFKGT